MQEDVPGEVSKPSTTTLSEERVRSGEVASIQEVRSWYVYDWANSPFWQVTNVFVPILLKRSAEFAEGTGNFPANRISAGSYPAVIGWFTAALQVVCLLSFAAFGDFTNRRKQLLQILTFSGSACVLLLIVCFSSDTWWLAGLLRTFAGACFVLTQVYYNAFLPLLASAHYDVVHLAGDERTQHEVAVQDEMSNKGQLLGYCGGTAMQLMMFILLVFVECDPAEVACRDNEFERLFWIGLCVSSVGIWWSVFSLYTFKHLKTRPGRRIPDGANIFCLGWQQAWETLGFLCKYKHTLLFVIAYFLWSDALATILNIAILVLEEGSGSDGERTKDSSLVMSVMLASVAGIIGVFGFLKLQQCLRLSNKVMLLVQLSVFTFVSAACGCGLVTAFGGYGYYLAMFPVPILMGSLQANQRSLYCSLSPVGKEAAMFAFYSITDKGSSLLGTGVTAVVHTTTGSYVAVFWYCALAFGVSAAILWFVDVNKGLVDAGKTSSSACDVSKEISNEAVPVERVDIDA